MFLMNIDKNIIYCFWLRNKLHKVEVKSLLLQQEILYSAREVNKNALKLTGKNSRNM
jgi:hypothetical protein